MTDPSPLLRIQATIIEEVLDTERRIARSQQALRPVLEHAEKVAALDAAIRKARLPVKATYASAGLDYQLARHAMWIAETVSEHSEAHSEISRFGPSLVLLVREAARRFEREDRADQLPELIRDISDGMPRRIAREKYLPPKPRRGMNAVIAAVRAGRMEPARRLLDECSPDELKELRVFATGLGLIVTAHSVDSPSVPRRSDDEGEQTPGSIDEAIRRAGTVTAIHVASAG